MPMLTPPVTPAPLPCNRRRPARSLEAERDKALTEMNGHFLSNRPIRVSLATAKKNANTTTASAVQAPHPSGAQLRASLGGCCGLPQLVLLWFCRWRGGWCPRTGVRPPASGPRRPWLVGPDRAPPPSRVLVGAMVKFTC